MSQTLSRFSSLFTTTLAQTLDASETSLILTTTEGLLVGSYITLTIDRVDLNNSATLDKREVIQGVVAENNVITALIRGCDGTTAQAHTTGAMVEQIFTAYDWNMMKDKVNSVDGLITNEIPPESPDGTRTTFSLQRKPGYRGLSVWSGARRLTPCSLKPDGTPDTSSGDFYFEDTTVTFTEPPWPGTQIIFDYKVSDNDAAAADTNYEDATGQVTALQLQEIRQLLVSVRQQNNDTLSDNAEIKAALNTQAATMTTIATIQTGLVSEVFSLKSAANGDTTTIQDLLAKTEDLQAQIDEMNETQLAQFMKYLVINEEHKQTTAGNSEFILNYEFLEDTIQIKVGAAELAKGVLPETPEGETLTDDQKLAIMTTEQRKDFVVVNRDTDGDGEPDTQVVILTTAPEIGEIMLASYWKRKI